MVVCADIVGAGRCFPLRARALIVFSDVENSARAIEIGHEPRKQTPVPADIADIRAVLRSGAAASTARIKAFQGIPLAVCAAELMHACACVRIRVKSNSTGRTCFAATRDAVANGGRVQRAIGTGFGCREQYSAGNEKGDNGKLLQNIHKLILSQNTNRES